MSTIALPFQEVIDNSGWLSLEVDSTANYFGNIRIIAQVLRGISARYYAIHNHHYDWNEGYPDLVSDYALDTTHTLSTYSQMNWGPPDEAIKCVDHWVKALPLVLCGGWLILLGAAQSTRFDGTNSWNWDDPHIADLQKYIPHDDMLNLNLVDSTGFSMGRSFINTSRWKHSILTIRECIDDLCLQYTGIHKLVLKSTNGTHYKIQNVDKVWQELPSKGHQINPAEQRNLGHVVDTTSNGIVWSNQTKYYDWAISPEGHNEVIFGHIYWVLYQWYCMTYWNHTYSSTGERYLQFNRCLSDNQGNSYSSVYANSYGQLIVDYLYTPPRASYYPNYPATISTQDEWSTPPNNTLTYPGDYFFTITSWLMLDDHFNVWKDVDVKNWPMSMRFPVGYWRYSADADIPYTITDQSPCGSVYWGDYPYISKTHNKYYFINDTIPEGNNKQVLTYEYTSDVNGSYTLTLTTDIHNDCGKDIDVTVSGPNGSSLTANYTGTVQTWTVTIEDKDFDTVAIGEQYDSFQISPNKNTQFACAVITDDDVSMVIDQWNADDEYAILYNNQYTAGYAKATLSA